MWGTSAFSDTQTDFKGQSSMALFYFELSMKKNYFVFQVA